MISFMTQLRCVFNSAGHWLTRSIATIMWCKSISILDSSSSICNCCLSSLKVPRETHLVGFSTIAVWRFACGRTQNNKPLANILARSMSRLLLPVHTAPVPSHNF